MLNRYGIFLLFSFFFCPSVLPFITFFDSLLFFQIYFASRLDLPHYQVSSTELPSFLSEIDRFSTRKKRKDLEVVHLKNGVDHYGEYLNVFNTLSPSMQAISDRMPLRALAEKVLLSNVKDTSRGNKFIDTGFASECNQRRTRRHAGVATPNPLKRTVIHQSSSSKSSTSSSPSPPNIFHQAMLGMTELLDLVCPPKMIGKVFSDPSRERLFAGRIVKGNKIEALRVALTNEHNVVSCHCDDKNDVSENFQPVINNTKWFFLSDGQWWRLSIIAYSRKSVAGSIRRLDLYKPLVTRIAHFYNRMPESRKFITPSLLDFSKCPPDVDAIRIKPHANKCVFYSVYVHCLTLLQRRFRLSKWHVLALVTNSIISETPEYFHLVTKNLLAMTGTDRKRFRSLGPISLAWQFYTMVFDEKDRRSSNKAPVPGQRHQPHYNKRRSRDVVKKSILNFYRLSLAFEHLDPKLAADPHFYGKAVSHLEDGYEGTGVCGAGGLTGQHLVHIGVLCGFFPAGMMAHAEIGASTNSYKYLSQWEGMVDHAEDTRQLLACLSHFLNLPYLLVENIICKFGQDQVEQPPPPLPVPNRPAPKPKPAAPQSTNNAQKGKRKSRKERELLSALQPVWKHKPTPYCDSLYRDQSLYYLDVADNLVEVTDKCTRKVPFLASRCVEVAQSLVQPVPFQYWQNKVKAKRVVPMKTCTRTHLKSLMTATLHAKIPSSTLAVDVPPDVDDDQFTDYFEAAPEYSEDHPHIVVDDSSDDEDDDDILELFAMSASVKQATRIPRLPTHDDDADDSPPAEETIGARFIQRQKRTVTPNKYKPKTRKVDPSFSNQSPEHVKPAPARRKLAIRPKKKETAACDHYGISPSDDSDDNSATTKEPPSYRRRIVEDIEDEFGVAPESSKLRPYRTCRLSNLTTGKFASSPIDPCLDDTASEAEEDSASEGDEDDKDEEWIAPRKKVLVENPSAAVTHFHVQSTHSDGGDVAESDEPPRKKVPIENASVDLTHLHVPSTDSDGDDEVEWQEPSSWDVPMSLVVPNFLCQQAHIRDSGCNTPTTPATPVIDHISVIDDFSVIDEVYVPPPRRPFLLQQAAMKALSVPSFQKKNIIYHQIHLLELGQHRTYWAAHLSYHILNCRPTITWVPPNNMNSDLVAAFSPGSIIGTDGRRLHRTRKLAMAYLSIAAVVGSDSSFISDLLGKRSPEADTTLLMEPGKGGILTNARQLAVIAKNQAGPGYFFSFVDASGLPIGDVLSSTSSM
jgi:hypothetical protein